MDTFEVGVVGEAYHGTYQVSTPTALYDREGSNSGIVQFFSGNTWGDPGIDNVFGSYPLPGFAWASLVINAGAIDPPILFSFNFSNLAGQGSGIASTAMPAGARAFSHPMITGSPPTTIYAGTTRVFRSVRLGWQPGYSQFTVVVGIPPMYRVIHDNVVGCSVFPAHDTHFLANSDVFIEVSDYFPQQLDVFTVNGLDCLHLLAPVPLFDGSHGSFVNVKPILEFAQYAVLGADDDIHITAIAKANKFFAGADFQCKAGCSPEHLWSISTPEEDELPGLSITHDGLVSVPSSLVRPDDAYAGEHSATILFEEEGHQVTREALISVPEYQVPGNEWVGIGKLYAPIDWLFQPSDSDNILAGAGENIYLSTDNGYTWTQKVNVPGGTFCAVRNPGNFGVWEEPSNGETYVFYNHQPTWNCQVWMSPDKGLTWSMIGNIMSDWGRVVNVVNAGGVFIAAHHYYSERVYVWKSTNYGRTWTWSRAYASGLNYWWASMAKNPDTGSVIAIKSNTGGPVSFMHANIGTPDDFYAGNTTFVRSGNPTGLLCYTTSKTGRVYGSGTSCSIWYSDNDGWDWTEKKDIESGLASNITALYAQNRVVLAGVQGKFMRSSNSGESFVDVKSGFTDGDPRVIIKLSDGSLLAGTSGVTTNLYRSEV